MTLTKQIDQQGFFSLFSRTVSQLIDGKLVSQKIKDQVASDVAAFIKKTGIVPGLATVLVGADPASHVYVKNKVKSTKACGMNSIHKELPADTSEEALLKIVHELNNDENVHGILVQLPLPKHINADKILESINPAKDVDGFHPVNVGRLVAGRDCLMPCTPYGVMELLSHYGISLSGQDVVIIGRSNIVGKPQALMMLAANATVTITHSKTRNLPERVREADIVVAAIGRAKFVKADWLKPGCVVIDVGINRLEDGTLCGDVDFNEAKQVASYITPVPGGVGPMTIAMLMKNTLKAAAMAV